MHEYKKVKITLTTNDAGMKITPKDHRLAQGINRLSQT
jgi:pterin-4a-carbinolamine dehydratase